VLMGYRKGLTQYKDEQVEETKPGKNIHVRTQVILFNKINNESESVTCQHCYVTSLPNAL
jgi:hypothetical protein